jgi:hypothetical protein
MVQGEDKESSKPGVDFNNPFAHSVNVPIHDIGLKRCLLLSQTKLAQLY